MYRKILLSFLLCSNLHGSCCDHHAKDAQNEVVFSTGKLKQFYARSSSGKNSAVYMGITNSSTEQDEIISASCQECSRVEFHDHLHDKDGVLRMRPMDKVLIPAGQELLLVPGGKHIMLIGLKRPLVAGETIELSLVFAKGGKLELQVPVK